MCWGHRPTETPLLAVVAVPNHAEHHECSLTLYCAPSLPPTVGGITSHYKHKAPPTGCMGMDALFGEDRHVHPQGEGAPKGRRGGGEAPQMSLRTNNTHFTTVQHIAQILIGPWQHTTIHRQHHVCVCVCVCVHMCVCTCVCVCVHVSHEPLPLTPPVTGCMSRHTAAMGWQSSRYIPAMPAHVWPQYRVTRT